MLQAFIITLREGVEAALIVGITLAYLTKIGRQELRKTVYAALAAAFLGSIGVAVVISRTHLNEDVFEGWVMLVAAFFVITMVVFMMKTGRKLKGDIEGKVGLLRVEYRPWAREYDISHALKAGQDGADMAKSFTISGLAEAPRVTLNGRPADVRVAGQAFRFSVA